MQRPRLCHARRRWSPSMTFELQLSEPWQQLSSLIATVTRLRSQTAEKARLLRAEVVQLQNLHHRRTESR